MSEYMEKLEERIRRLKTDSVANKSWHRLKFEIERRGGRWVADNGLIFELRDGAIYQYLSDHEQGVSNLVIVDMDAPVPYVATLDIDLQGTPPERRKALLEELQAQAKVAPPARARTDLVVVVKGDWLSKISMARWGTTDWRQHLKPTEMTLRSRKRRGKGFDPDLIYPGDTFEMVA